MNYETAKNMYENSRKRKLAGHTYLIKTERGYGIKFWDTVIVEYHSDGVIVLDTGGYFTRTTKSRINQFTENIRVYQKDFNWYIETGSQLLDLGGSSVIIYPG